MTGLVPVASNATSRPWLTKFSPGLRNPQLNRLCRGVAVHPADDLFNLHQVETSRCAETVSAKEADDNEEATHMTCHKGYDCTRWPVCFQSKAQAGHGK